MKLPPPPPPRPMRALRKTPPPPPKKISATDRSRLRRTPPPPPKKIRREVIKPTIGPVADPHTMRTTLNLIRHAACSSPELRAAVDMLAARAWDIDALAAAEPVAAEVIFGEVNDDLAARAKDEFYAVTSTCIDYRSSDAICPLCGHQHIRFVFTLRNRNDDGRDIQCGSTCIIKWGFNVDGDLTGEAALKAINKAISDMKRAASREFWQAQRPEHLDEMRDLWRFAFRRTTLSSFMWPGSRLFPYLNPNWYARVKTLRKAARPIAKYYEAERFLTAKKDAQAYGDEVVRGGVVQAARDMMVEYDHAVRQYEAQAATNPKPY